MSKQAGVCTKQIIDNIVLESSDCLNTTQDKKFPAKTQG